MIDVTIKGSLLCEFVSYQQWVNKAAAWLGPYKSEAKVCIDTDGFVCHIGADFMESRDKDRFPVKVYLLLRSSAYRPENGF